MTHTKHELARVVPTPDGTITVAPGRYGRMAILAAFELNGGTQRLAEWIRESPENERDFYTKMFPRVVQKEVEVTAGGGVDKLVKLFAEKVDAALEEEVLDAEFEEILREPG